MRHTLNQLVEIATETRAEFAAGSVPMKTLSRLYLARYPDDEQAIRAIVRHPPVFPDRYCELATVYLLDKLGEGEFGLGRYDGRPHAFADMGATALQSTTIVDITADSLGGPPIYVGPVIDPWEASILTTNNYAAFIAQRPAIVLPQTSW
jgi:hypothetical protein